MSAAAFVALLAAATSTEAPAVRRAPWLTPEQAEKLAQKLAERQPYAESDEARSPAGSATMGLFFKDADYQKLRGNPVYGYWNASGFRWTGNRIAWDGVVAGGQKLQGNHQESLGCGVCVRREKARPGGGPSGADAHARRLRGGCYRDVARLAGPWGGDGDEAR